MFAFHLRESPHIEGDLLTSVDALTLRHLRVARIQPGEELVLIYAGARILCELVSLSQLELTAKVVSEERPEKPNPTLIFALAALKGAKNEDALFALTQLGVDAFILFASARTIARRVSVERFQRFSKKVLEACEVSDIVHPPEVLWVDGVSDLLASMENYAPPPSHRLLFFERARESRPPLSRITASAYDDRPCVAVIGPEGGFEDSEVREFENARFKTVTLGVRVLEARVAAYYIASRLAAWMGKLG